MLLFLDGVQHRLPHDMPLTVFKDLQNTVESIQNLQNAIESIQRFAEQLLLPIPRCLRIAAEGGDLLQDGCELL